MVPTNEPSGERLRGEWERLTRQHRARKVQQLLGVLKGTGYQPFVDDGRRRPEAPSRITPSVRQRVVFTVMCLIGVGAFLFLLYAAFMVAIALLLPRG